MREETQAAAKAFGAKVRDLRESKGWNRAQFLAHFHDTLETMYGNYEIRSEAWLGRLEAGNIVQRPRSDLNAICETLECSKRQRVKLLLLAGLSVVTEGPGDANDIITLLHCAMMDIANDAAELIEGSLADRRIDDLRSHPKIT